MNLKTKLNKVNNIFTRARKQYLGLVDACEVEIAEAEYRIRTAEAAKVVAEGVKTQAKTSVEAINGIIGE